MKMFVKNAIGPSSWVAVIAGIVAGGSVALAGEEAQVVVEAKAPVHTQNTVGGMPAGTQVELLSVAYTVPLTGLDLTKTADMAKAQEQVKAAAKKGCTTIQAEYPTRPMSDQRSCETEAVARANAQLTKLVAGKH
ncbi:MAG: UrcA family protein [Proteobacteria bacterium]|nr:UrcA family protein [Pseudomonadota bacterium]